MRMLKLQWTLQQNTPVWSWVPGLTQPQLFIYRLPLPSPGCRADQKVCSGSAFDIPAVTRTRATL